MSPEAERLLSPIELFLLLFSSIHYPTVSGSVPRDPPYGGGFTKARHTHCDRHVTVTRSHTE